LPIDYFTTMIIIETNFLKSIGFFALILVITSCSGVDINDEQEVMNDIQGTWIGSEYIDGLFRHIKVNIKDNTFDGWLQTSHADIEPSWTVLPTESGIFSLSSVLDNPKDDRKFRKFSFVINGRCCGDNSPTAKTLSELIAYMDRKGLFIAQQAAVVAGIQHQN
jgi:hypothetical protein